MLSVGGQATVRMQPVESRLICSLVDTWHRLAVRSAVLCILYFFFTCFKEKTVLFEDYEIINSL